MTKKNLQAEVTIRVLGKDLTKAEAEELYMALGSALGKIPSIQYIYRDRPYPYWHSNNLIGNGTGGITTSNSISNAISCNTVTSCYSSDTAVPIGELHNYTSKMVELITNEE